MRNIFPHRMMCSVSCGGAVTPLGHRISHLLTYYNLIGAVFLYRDIRKHYSVSAEISPVATLPGRRPSSFIRRGGSLLPLRVEGDTCCWLHWLVRLRLGAGQYRGAFSSSVAFCWLVTSAARCLLLPREAAAAMADNGLLPRADDHHGRRRDFFCSAAATSIGDGMCMDSPYEFPVCAMSVCMAQLILGYSVRGWFVSTRKSRVHSPVRKKSIYLSDRSQ